MISLPLLITSILCVAAESTCPRGCDCDYASVICINKSLKKVPDLEQLTEEPMIIDLSGNQISVIDENDFSFMLNNGVKEIYLNNSEVLDIDSAAFEELQNLQELYLGDNLLSEIAEDMIEDLPNMIVLDMSNNHFLGVMPLIKSKSLRVLALANSKISIVSEDSLKFLPSLTILLLQSNNIKTINPSVFSYVTAETFSVKFSYNLWECSCENFELFESLETNKYISKSDPVTCMDESDEMDVFDVGYVDIMRSKCRILSDDSKVVLEPHHLNETSYSLIKSVDKKPPFVIDIQQNEPPSTAPVIPVNRTEENNTETSKCLERNDIFQMKYHLELIVIVSIFAMGLFLGCFLNQFVSLSKYTKLKQSDVSLYT